ncbi:MAG: hypothetical protein DBY43_05525 [Clostridiaceae bacterium]|nr:MAG: hypothetical protein DBY43_05525 [Clostridiaceae bacterium]
MNDKKINRAIKVCGAMKYLKEDIEYDSGEDVHESPYAMHELFKASCDEAALSEGVSGKAVFRQLTTRFGVDEDTLSNMMLEFLEAKPERRDTTRFTKLLYTNMSKKDTLEELKDSLDCI